MNKIIPLMLAFVIAVTPFNSTSLTAMYDKQATSAIYDPDNRNLFVNYLYAHLKHQNSDNYIQVYSPVIAQAILESGWGKSYLARKGNNLFGIKAGKSWDGRVLMLKTREAYTNGKLVTTYATFRAYDSLEESIADYLKLIHNKRYAKLHEATNYIEYCEALQASGYATSPKYAITLIHLIENLGLTQFDN